MECIQITKNKDLSLDTRMVLYLSDGQDYFPKDIGKCHFWTTEKKKAYLSAVVLREENWHT